MIEDTLDRYQVMDEFVSLASTPEPIDEYGFLAGSFQILPAFFSRSASHFRPFPSEQWCHRFVRCDRSGGTNVPKISPWRFHTVTIFQEWNTRTMNSTWIIWTQATESTGVISTDIRQSLLCEPDDNSSKHLIERQILLHARLCNAFSQNWHWYIAYLENQLDSFPSESVTSYHSALSTCSEILVEIQWAIAVVEGNTDCVRKLHSLYRSQYDRISRMEALDAKREALDELWNNVEYLGEFYKRLTVVARQFRQLRSNVRSINVHITSES